MKTNDFINDCMKCINMCKKEFCDEFTEWIEKLILSEVAGTSENTECITDKSITQELSIENIKKELMNAFLGDMRIIKSFANKNVEKTTDYIRKNVFDYLDELPSCICTDTYIYFDVTQRNNNDYEVYVVIKMHKDILGNDGENRLDSLANAIEGIVRKSYPYMTRYKNMPKVCANSYAERHIYFSLEKFEKSCYENGDKPMA